MRTEDKLNDKYETRGNALDSLKLGFTRTNCEQHFFSGLEIVTSLAVNR